MKKILVVDDSVTNLKFVESVLKDIYKLILVKSGEQAIKYLAENSVDLVLLDIIMPQMDGFEVYERIRQLENNVQVPVIFLTADVDVESEIKCLKMGAVDFIKKPFVPEVMVNRINRILRFEDLNKHLEELVAEKTNQIEQLSFETISTIAGIIEAKDSYTKEHSVRVAEYSALIAKKAGWRDEDIQNLKYIALLHDIGKIGIPDSIINKPAKLTAEEFNIIKSHTTIGGDLLKDIETIADVGAGAKYHHEKFDGTGYPCGLIGNHIPAVARIICIADSYDAMNSKRAYRDRMDIKDIRRELIEGRGTQFDPEYLDIFMQILDEGGLDLDFSELNQRKTLSAESNKLINHILKSIREEAKKTETHDYLTGLLGRRAGEGKIAQAMKMSSGCLAFIDLDNLKRTNDTMGHLAGDCALKTVGNVLMQHGDNCIVCRLGGDEFLYYMMGANKQQATETIKKVMASFDEIKAQNTYLSVSSLSIGLCMTGINDNLTDVVTLADRALYHVKQSGKCGFYFYNNEAPRDNNSASIDLEKLVLNLKQQGAYEGTLNLEYREFAKVCDYIRHLGERYDYALQIVMITMEPSANENLYVEEREQVMNCMEKTIKASLRSVDVSTRFSGEQFIVILMNAQDEYVDIITKRIEDNFHKIYDKNLVRVRFDVENLSKFE